MLFSFTTRCYINKILIIIFMVRLKSGHFQGIMCEDSYLGVKYQLVNSASKFFTKQMDVKHFDIVLSTRRKSTSKRISIKTRFHIGIKQTSTRKTAINVIRKFLYKQVTINPHVFVFMSTQIQLNVPRTVHDTHRYSTFSRPRSILLTNIKIWIEYDSRSHNIRRWFSHWIGLNN